LVVSNEFILIVFAPICIQLIEASDVKVYSAVLSNTNCH
jgi:hypothetical protein